MAKHQIIYTSCMRGIDGVNDGQQIYSYDKKFSECKSDDVKSLFTYQLPSLSSGVTMTEEIARTMPSAFLYRKLKNGNSSVALNTYLGRDYMGSAGRFGNHLSHAIITDFDDFSLYPCELYEGPELRDCMKYEEVNNPDKPDFLPQPTLEKGNIINIDEIIEFLDYEDRMEHYKKMIVALLEYHQKKKRIIICDTKENIIKWIAAIHYSLPLEIAKNVNFTTYEFNPELSAAQICGVIKEGSRYNVESYMSSERYYVFDFFSMKFSDINADSTYIDFIDTALSFSYDSLQEFHKFILENTSFRNVNTDMYSAYLLYTLYKEGIQEINIDEFNKAIEFGDSFGNTSVIADIANNLMDKHQELIKISSKYGLVVIEYLIKHRNKLDEQKLIKLKKIIMTKIITSIVDIGITKEEFISIYSKLDELGRAMNFSIPVELMKSETNSKLISAINDNTAVWKLNFMIKIVSDYVKDTNLMTKELYLDRPVGELYYKIIKVVFAHSKKESLSCSKKILDCFNTNENYLTIMVLNIEMYLKKLKVSADDIKDLWNYFISIVSKLEINKIYIVNKILKQHDHIEEMFMIYDGAQLLKKDDAYIYLIELIDIAKKNKSKGNAIDIVLEEVIDKIDIDKPVKKSKDIIYAVKKYKTDTCGTNINGKLLFLYICLKIDESSSREDIYDITKEVVNILGDKLIKLSDIEDMKVEAIFELILNRPLTFSLESEDLIKIYKMFEMTDSQSVIFMKHCMKQTYRGRNEIGNYNDFIEFLKFMFEYGTTIDIENVGKYIKKEGKQKLQDIDKEVLEIMKNDEVYLEKWKQVYESVSRPNPILNNLSGLFKRKNNK